MTDDGPPKRAVGRWVSVRLQHRRVSFGEQEPAPPAGGTGDEAGDESLSYSGIVITGYEQGCKVSERWIPLGVDPSEADDERLIEQLREALLWQAGRPPQAAGE